MIARRRQYDKEEFARRGDELYARVVAPALSHGDLGKIVAIDIESGAWELDTDELRACERLRSKHPEAQTWIVRVGSPYVRRFGGGRVDPQ